MKRAASMEQQLVESLVRAHAHEDPSGFSVQVLSNGALRIKGPYATACYPVAGWTERFTVHLRQGLFTSPALPPTVSRQPAPASGGTGS